jgi:SAM-dependent methyltransferase
MPVPHRCPWYIGYFLISPLRKLWQNPARILAPYVRPGFAVFEPGPGMGYFTLELARLVGPSGKVHVVDVEARMLTALDRRVRAAGLAARIDARVAGAESFGIGDLAGTVDFVLAFAVVHELPSAEEFFVEAAAAMKPGGTMLFAEPAGHVGVADFERSCADAARAGLIVTDRPTIRSSHAVVFAKR